MPAKIKSLDEIVAERNNAVEARSKVDGIVEDLSNLPETIQGMVINELLRRLRGAKKAHGAT